MLLGEMTEAVLYEKRNRVAFVTLNRPDAKNAVDPPMHDVLCRIWADFRDDAELDVAILSENGDASARAPTCGPTCR